MRTVLICHDEHPLDRDGLARWLASFSELVGVVILRETASQKRLRIRRELKRVGLLRFFDVVAFRLYDRIVWGRANHEWESETLAQLGRVYPPSPPVPQIFTSSPNSPEAEAFIRQSACDIMIARCKTLLSEQIFMLPDIATLVMHPGICPEYRNAYGCFWALAENDLEKVGMTLLKVNAGIDSGEIYGYYSYDYDEIHESQMMIHYRVTFENLTALATKINEVYHGKAKVINTSGRASKTWGQPWLTRYLRWKRQAGQRKLNATNHTSLP